MLTHSLSSDGPGAEAQRCAPAEPAVGVSSQRGAGSLSSYQSLLLSAPYRQPAPATRRRCPRDLMGLSLDLFLSAVPPRLVCPRAHNPRKIKQELKLKINRVQQGT